MITVPKEFRPKAVMMYPAYCSDMMLEQYASQHMTETLGYEYLPVYWTNYYCQNDYGNGNIKPLVDWLDSLDKSKKYVTCVQYDDGILDKPIDLDLTIFSSGFEYGVPIPLLPSHYLYSPKTEKTYDLTFIGNISTHPLRKKAINDTGCWKMDGLLPQDYYKVLSQSEFTLCPRGYGVTSFRLYEALHCGAVPVYYSDVHWLPYKEIIDWNKLAVIVKPNENIRDRMAMHNQDWQYYQSVKHLFTMKGVVDYIKACLA